MGNQAAANSAGWPPFFFSLKKIPITRTSQTNPSHANFPEPCHRFCDIGEEMGAYGTMAGQAQGRPHKVVMDARKPARISEPSFLRPLIASLTAPPKIKT